MRKISRELTQAKAELDCSLLTDLDTKSEDQCLLEEYLARHEFQEEPVNFRLGLKPEDYFKALRTVAFNPVIDTWSSKNQSIRAKEVICFNRSIEQ